MLCKNLLSPEDAKSLIDEEDERKKQNGRSKLAGTTFANFGAFFERFWRQNDMLWGRLDSAERLITILLPGDQHKDDRKRLLEEAQETIIAEELKPRDHADHQSIPNYRLFYGRVLMKRSYSVIFATATK